MSANHSARSGGMIEIYFRFFNMKVCCVFSLESPHRGDSNEYTLYSIFNIKRKTLLIILNLQLWVFIPGDSSKRVVNESSVFEPLKVYCNACLCPFSLYM